MRQKYSELYSGSVRLFLLAMLLVAFWVGLNLLFPDLWTTGVPMMVTRFVIFGTILIGLWLGLSRADFTASTRVNMWLAIAVPYTLWLALVWGLAAHGVFTIVMRMPGGPIAVIFGPVLIGLVLLTRSEHIASLIDAMPPSWLIGLQLYRVFGGIFLVNWMHGAIPAALALPAGFGDVTVGLLALPAALWRSTAARRWKIRSISPAATARATLC